MNLTNKKVAVLGAGRSGRAAARLAAKLGANVCLFDSSDIDPMPEGICAVAKAGEKDGLNYRADLVIISPGIETDCPFAQAFSGSADEMIGELEFSSRFYAGKIIAITGTNGKTTTTSLVEKILIRAGIKAVACGNYGVPLAELLLNDDVPDVLALEVSSFQLETVRDFHADVAVWLNFAPDHMDRYKSVEAYYNDKLHIFDRQDSKDIAVVRVGEKLPTLQAQVETFGSFDDSGTLSFKDGWICEQGSPILDLRETHMEQRHNAENVMAALLACRALGVEVSTIQETLGEFTPPGHRCEVVRKFDGVIWMNDSKSTNLHSTEAALRSQTAPVILIAGGKDKGLDYSSVLPLLREKARASIVFGQISDQLYHEFSSAVTTQKASTVEECVALARELAKKGDVVLFSPGTSSFDMFSSYVQRGQVFRDAVNHLQ